MNNRRKLLVALGAAAVAPGTVHAQSKQPAVVGWFNWNSRETAGHYLATFRDGLTAFGWKEGQQLVIEERWGDGRLDTLPTLAAELAARKPAVIVAAPLPAVAAIAKAAPNIPIVIATGGDPVAAGFVKSLARPGGMITGLTSFRADLAEKYLELLLAAVPKLTRVGFLADPRSFNYRPVVEGARRSAARHPVEAHFADVAAPEQVAPAISRLAKEGVQGLVVLNVFSTDRRSIMKSALAQRWPIVASGVEWADEGALLTYGISDSANYQRAAYFVDRILKGATPVDLPVEQPTKIELIISLKTARALGITIPQSILVRADRVIE